MFLLVFVVLLGTIVTVNDAPPEVEIDSEIFNNGRMMLTCRARGFNTSDIVLNIKKNHCVLTEEDGVNTTGVKPENNTYWRRDHVIVPQSEVSDYSCEVVHAASRFRVEKVWDPDSDGGRIISSKFIDTTSPDVEMFAENSEDQTNNIVTCLASGFYPNNIILNMKRNGRILTREDGVKSSGVCSYEDDTFQRRDSVEIKTSDKSNYSCEVIHDASGSRVEKFWDHQLLPSPPSGPGGDNTGAIIAAVTGVLLLVVVLLYWFIKRIRGAANRCRTGRPANNPPVNYTSAKPAAPPSGGDGVTSPLLDGGAPAAADPPPANGNALTNAELNGNVQHHINTPSGPSSSEQETPE